MTRRLIPVFCCALVAALGAIGGCATSSDTDTDLDPFAMADESEPDLLDSDSGVNREDRRRRRPQRTTDTDGDVLYIIPEARSEPSRTIDAQPDDWDSAEFRDFDTADHVFEGRQHWEGPEDTSFSAAVTADDSHIFFFVGVIDDHVVSSSPTDPIDAVVLRLRDPQLDDLLESLPKSLRDRLDVHLEMAIAITPDGQAAPYDTSASLFPHAIEVAAKKTSAGYLVEAALSLEVLPYIADMPMNRLAFAIEVFDGDDSSTSGPTKKLSAVVRSSADRPGFATIDTEGLLPATAPEGGPPRHDALGVWNVDGDRWRFRSMEYFSPHWNALDDMRQVAAEFADTQKLPDICHGAANDKQVVEAYESAAGSRRTALILCGTEASGSQCSSGAQSQLIWTDLQKHDAQWEINAAHPVFDAPLEQCLLTPSATNAYYHRFSMLPFDRIGPSVWGIGYHKQRDTSRRHIRETGVVIVDPGASDFVLAQRPLQRIEAGSRERTRHDSRLYLTDLDDDGALDLCHIEEIREQRCDFRNSGCTTRDRGHEVIAHVDMWDESQHRFETYLLSRHNHCRGSTDFDTVSGFKLLVVGDRLGMLPTGGD